ncbi:hypothetical protein DB30_04150 [Enhygromyxa salina]|uniref:Uncharacterized protein n=2 Tax=Enhygromyxa salina TaxID=215803 RepID=A0A0C2D0P4_9BACT|nr:hypothetical protein DB30_04150 [Enhygromyxa salina]
MVNPNTMAAMATAAASSLETTAYTSSSTHDALGPVLTAISPDGSEVAYGLADAGVQGDSAGGIRANNRTANRYLRVKGIE